MAARWSRQNYLQCLWYVCICFFFDFRTQVLICFRVVLQTSWGTSAGRDEKIYHQASKEGCSGHARAGIQCSSNRLPRLHLPQFTLFREYGPSTSWAGLPLSGSQRIWTSWVSSTHGSPTASLRPATDWSGLYWLSDWSATPCTFPFARYSWPVRPPSIITRISANSQPIYPTCIKKAQLFWRPARKTVFIPKRDWPHESLELYILHPQPHTTPTCRWHAHWPFLIWHRSATATTILTITTYSTSASTTTLHSFREPRRSRRLGPAGAKSSTAARSRAAARSPQSKRAGTKSEREGVGRARRRGVMITSENPSLHISPPPHPQGGKAGLATWHWKLLMMQGDQK